MLKGIFISNPYPYAGSLIVINTVCEAVGTCLISSSVFLSIYGFFTMPAVNKAFLLSCLGGSILLFLMFYGYYEQYSIINRSLDKFEHSLVVPKELELPDIVQRARLDDSVKRREQLARVAYILYGVRLSYQGERNDWTYYSPTKEEVEEYESERSLDLSVEKLRVASQDFLAGVCNMVLYVFITFLFGLLWLAVKKPRFSEDSLASQNAPV